MTNTKVLRKALDRVQADVFINKNDAFLAPIMCQLNIVFDEGTKTVCVTPHTMKWNPTWFMKLPEKTRNTVLVHEVWHIGLMHELRRGNRDPKIWNFACDVEINNRLEKLGYSFAGTKPWKDASLGNMVAEDIYDLLVKNPSKYPQSGDSWSGEDGTGDMAGDESGDVSPADRQKILEMVSYAHAVAKLAGGKVDPRIGELLDKFLEPKIDWRNRFRALMRPYRAKKRSWQFRNRRYTAILPSNKGKVKQLDHIVFFIDVSGSITTEQARRFITEVKKAQQDYEPRKMTVVQFDTDIVRVDEFKKNDKLDKLQIIGRGGTHLQCVTDWLNEHKPELAVLFSDMYCNPMVEPEVTKMIFIVQDNPRFSSFGFGSVIHVQD